MADANRDVTASKGSPPAAMRGRLSERAWADVRIAAKLAREEGVTLKVHGIEVTGLLKQQKVHPVLRIKVQKKPTETVAPTLPSTTAADAAPPPMSTRQRRSQQRLLEFQEKKRAAAAAVQPVSWCSPHLRPDPAAHRKRKLLVKLRSILWRAWARWRPIFGGSVLYYTSLREQYVYKRAGRLYNAAFKSDPGKSGRTLAAWLRHATPMDEDRAAKRGAAEPPPRAEAKKSRG